MEIEIYVSQLFLSFTIMIFQAFVIQKKLKIIEIVKVK